MKKNKISKRWYVELISRKQTLWIFVIGSAFLNHVGHGHSLKEARHSFVDAILSSSCHQDTRTFFGAEQICRVTMVCYPKKIKRDSIFLGIVILINWTTVGNMQRAKHFRIMLQPI